jgi:peptidoglycan/xylan/chitin deacetylase (PgdA/CDA1 family)
MSQIRPAGLLNTLLWGGLVLFFVSGCTGRFLPGSRQPAVVKEADFCIVTVSEQDTFAQLAQTYLGDYRQAWRIQSYNHVASIETGQQLVIPLRETNFGGLAPNGYQILPILYYPEISRDTNPSGTLSDTAFTNQMKLLKGNGYMTPSLDQVEQFLSAGKPLPPKAILISFDTEDRWVYETAYPILKEFAFTAAVFIATQRIEKKGALKWSELAEMAEAGFDIGSQGHMARSLLKKGSEETTEDFLKAIESEIAGSKKIISKRLGRPCHYFAYPDGDTNDFLIAELKQYGYRLAFTRQQGSNPFFIDNFQVHRMIINNQLNPTQFQQHVRVFQPVELQ